jgi:hypothetical protein
VSWLENPTTIPADVVSRLARTWDTSGQGGLTDADYATILQRDPCVNSAYNPNTDPLHRYDYQGVNFDYEPGAQGEQPAPVTHAVSHQVTTANGKTSTDSYGVSYTYDVTSSLTGNVLGVSAKLSDDVKSTLSMTLTNKWSSTLTNTVGTSATLSITGPAYADNYTGPTQMEVWKDNIYGTYMFYPVN